MPYNQNTQKFTQNHQTEVKVKAMLHWSIIFALSSGPARKTFFQPSKVDKNWKQFNLALRILSLPRKSTLVTVGHLSAWFSRF